MKQIDITYQTAVDREADKTFKLTIDELLKIDDYGTIQTSIDGKEITIGFWHYKLNDNLHHIVFKTSRRCYLILHKAYINGVKLENGKILKLTDKEIGDHD
jgi:hypothetical protein